MQNSNFPKALWLVVIIGFLILYFYGLNFVPLLGPDEPRYSQIAREMFERNDWLTPTLGGYNWFEKPALLYWLQHFAYNILVGCFRSFDNPADLSIVPPDRIDDREKGQQSCAKCPRVR
jgi:4-amino-4-deoxy-L-arabinose transferase-like glycosyltransferase